jgi:single-strand DNA-binding protein
MANLNKVMIIGNLTADPEVRTTPRGNSLTELRLAVNRVSTGQNEGERREETTFLDVTCWGRTGEIAAQYLSKGRPVFIEGRLQMDTWEDKQTGQRRSRIRIIAENLQLLGGRDGAPQGGGGYQSQPRNNYGNGGGYQQGNGGYGNNGGGYQQGNGGYGNNGGGYQQGNGYQQPQQNSYRPAPSQQPPMPPEEEDDIPF